MTGEGITVGGWLIPESELEERFDTPGGPGGQHANKNETAVSLRFNVDDSSLPEDIRQILKRHFGSWVEVTAADSRSQWRNRKVARDRLITKLEAAVVEAKPRKKTKPSKAAKERRLESKKARSEIKQKRRPPEVD